MDGHKKSIKSILFAIIKIVFIMAIWITSVIKIVRVLGKELFRVERLAQKNRSIMLLMGKWICIQADNKRISDYLSAKGYRKVAIYGMGCVGESLYKTLVRQGIDVIYGVDKNSDIVSVLPIITPEDEYPKADIIIVTAIVEYEDIKKFINKNTDIPVLSLEEVLDSLK